MNALNPLAAAPITALMGISEFMEKRAAVVRLIDTPPGGPVPNNSDQLWLEFFTYDPIDGTRRVP